MYRKFNYLTLITCCMLLFACTQNKSETLIEDISQKADELCTDPTCRILIQPYGTFPERWSNLAADKLVQYICENSWINITNVEILPPCALNDSLLNSTKSRYRANKILDAQLKSKKEYTDVIIGLTDKDISTSVHGRKDWGILGLAYIRKSVCVVSTYRIQNVEKDLGKVVFHEFNHAFLGIPHCPNNDPTCIMKDCNGKADFAHKTELCDSCKKLM